MISIITQLVLFYAIFYGIQSLLDKIRKLISKNDHLIITDEEIEARKSSKRKWAIILSIVCTAFTSISGMLLN